MRNRDETEFLSSQPRYDRFDTSAYMMQQRASYMQRPVRSGSRAQLLNPLRISHPKIDKLACQAQGADIFAKREIPLCDANRIHIKCYATACIIYAHCYCGIISQFQIKIKRLFKIFYFLLSIKMSPLEKEGSNSLFIRL